VTHYLYAGVLAGCLVITAPLEFVTGARVYRRPRLWLGTVVPVALAFAVTDALAHHAHWWTFASRYTLPLPRPLGLPMEEWAFFLVVPTCALLTLEAVRTLRPGWFDGAEAGRA
jgi:lycopene cyclase domain-containing protein